MEAAGLGIGAAALFSMVMAVFRAITSAHGFPESSVILFRQLELERQVLYQWGVDVGLEPENSGVECIIPSHLLSFVHEVVVTIGHLLAKATSKGQQYQRKGVDILDFKGILQTLQLQIEGQGREKSGFKRLGWAICEESGLKSLIEDIHKYNNSLHNLVPKPVQVRLDGSFLQRIVSNKDPSTLQETLEAARGLRQDVFAALNVALLTQNQKPIPSPPAANLILSRDCFAVIGTDMSRYVTTFTRVVGDKLETILVLIEWRVSKYDSQDQEGKQRHLRTSIDLARLFHASRNAGAYRTMDCLGIIEDVEFRTGPRIALVYRIPATVLNTLPIQSPSSIQLSILTLHDIINGKAYLRPSLGQRFELAQTLAIGIHRIIVSRWFHKNLNSRNILFLAPDAVKYDLKMLGTPFISGFQYARPDSSGQDTIKPDEDEFEDPYRHPDCTNPKSRKTIPYSRKFDFYSFGILLIEIGYWETIDGIHKAFFERSKNKGQTPSFHSFQEYLQKKCTDSIAYRMGDIYASATNFCLKGYKDENGVPANILAEDHIVDIFNAQVVSELAKCYA